ncbi:DUF768 domain-containing protein [Mesorhizobium sp. B3-2-1]|nr:DUF768 domain-containing protein [Mesorhizobium sp. B3-2-1]
MVSPKNRKVSLCSAASEAFAVTQAVRSLTPARTCFQLRKLSRRLFADAKAVGISSTEIEQDPGSVHEAVFNAIVHCGSGGL